MNQLSHKTALSNRPQTLRFHPASFTGKERDEETGYGYFGARYMDHELMTMWLSVDPMADKYPGISPYAYCAWNPVKLVDPDGRDWVVIFNHENKTVTIEAKYAAEGEARTSAEKAVKVWNDLSGVYDLMVGGEAYTVIFNLSVIDPSEAELNDPSLNAYRLVADFKGEDGKDNENILGECHGRIISIRESEKDKTITTSHEIGHSLGLLHPINGAKGLMEEDGGRLSGNHKIIKPNVECIINLAIHPDQRNSDFNSGIGSYKEIGCGKVDIRNPLNLNLIRNKKI